jgi:hypothetical protein
MTIRNIIGNLNAPKERILATSRVTPVWECLIIFVDRRFC